MLYLLSPGPLPKLPRRNRTRITAKPLSSTPQTPETLHPCTFFHQSAYFINPRMPSLSGNP
ncbi:hypothetical protein [Methanosarcina sp. WWM596]|uniref:hypothetical protein n=1 Tax=Methanosarcina sp. WWM596 TaxID=1434103 RepID=UPI0012E028B2|nr:hypothetical protein [Methanosarcina sp. WWM596]